MSGPHVTINDTAPRASVVTPRAFRPTRYQIEDYRKANETDDQVITKLLTNLRALTTLTYAVNAAGDIAFQTGRVYSVTSRHPVSTHINIPGEGMTSTVFSIDADGAGFDFMDPAAASPQASTHQFGGKSGNFTILGNDRPGCPITVGKGSGRDYENLLVYGAGGDGIQIYGTQNCSFRNLRTIANGGFGIRVDYGAAGVNFFGGQSTDNLGGDIGLTGQDGYQHSPPIVPETTEEAQIAFYGMVIEGDTQGAPIVNIGAGKNILFVGCPISGGAATVDCSIIKAWTENATLGSPTVTLLNCTLNAQTYTGTAPDNVKVRVIEADAGSLVVLAGRTVIANGYSGWYLEDNAVIQPTGIIDGLDTVGTTAPATITTTTQGDGSHNEVQTITLTGSPVGGVLNLNHRGQTTGSISATANAATIQAALEALTKIGAGNVAVTGGPWPAQVTITFQSALANTALAQITALTPRRLENKSSGTMTEDQILATWTYGHQIERYATNDRILVGKVASEVFPRFHIRADGTHGWGDGTANPDVNMFRSGSRRLRTDNYWRPGDLDTIRSVAAGASLPALTNLPAASASYEGFEVWVFGGGTVNDELYVCRRLFDGSYAWQPVRITPAVIEVPAGAFMNTSGATASQTTDGRTAIWQLPDAVTSHVGTDVYLPAWTPGYAVDVLWTAKDGTVTSVAWSLEVRLALVTIGAVPATTTIYGPTTQSTNGLTLGAWQKTTVATAYVPSAAGSYALRILRDGTDSYNGNVGLIAVRFTPN